MISTAPLGVGAAAHEPFSCPAGPANVTASVGSGAGPTGCAAAPVAAVEEEADGLLVDEAPLFDFDDPPPQAASRAPAAVAPPPSSMSRRSASRRVRNPSS